MKDFCGYVNEDIKFGGKSSFDFFLEIVDQQGNNFSKQKYLNMGSYSYFFTTEKVTDLYNVINQLELKQSLKAAYFTAYQIKDKRLSFFFGVKQNQLDFGFYDDIDHMVYKVGHFVVNDRYLKKLKHRSLKSIYSVLKKTNLKNITLLHAIREDFKKFWNKVDSTTLILDERRIKKSYDINLFKEEDRDNYKMLVTLEMSIREFSWFDKITYYTDVTDEHVNFYIKLKEKELYIYE